MNLTLPIKMLQIHRQCLKLTLRSAWLLLCAPLLSVAHSVSYDDMWWNPAESGWGVNIVQQEDVLFLTWFIYGSDGKPTWVTSDMRPTNATSFSGSVYSVTGSPYNAPAFMANQAQTVGTASLVFSDGNHGMLAYSINGLRVTKAITRLTFSAI